MNLNAGAALKNNLSNINNKFSENKNLDQKQTNNNNNAGIIVDNLTLEKIEIKMVGVRSQFATNLNQIQLEEKLIEYDKKIGEIGVKNVFASDIKSILFNRQEEQAVPEGTYMFYIRTDPSSESYHFGSGLLYLDKNNDQIHVKSKERIIIFRIAQTPIHAVDIEINTNTIHEMEIQQKENSKEWIEEQNETDNLILLGHRQATIYQPSMIPNQQYFLRQILIYDRKFGFEGIKQILLERQNQNQNQNILKGRKHLSNNIVIKKVIPVEQGIYKYEISNQPIRKKLYFSSSLEYFINSPQTIDQIIVQGSKSRVIEC